MALLLLLISFSRRTLVSSERSREQRTCAHNVTALPTVVCLISGTWQQLIVRQVDIQTNRGRKDRAVYWGAQWEREQGERRQQERLQVKKGQGWSEMRRREHSRIELLIECGWTSLILPSEPLVVCSCQSSLVLDLIIALQPVNFSLVTQRKDRRPASLWVSVWADWQGLVFVTVQGKGPGHLAAAFAAGTHGCLIKGWHYSDIV